MPSGDIREPLLGTYLVFVLWCPARPGERVPFLFTVKNLDAKGTLDAFGGDFTVPSYRGSSFLDPKVTICPADHHQTP